MKRLQYDFNPWPSDPLLFPPNDVINERRDGRVVGFYDGFVVHRRFPVDMAGFAVGVRFLKVGI